MRNDCLLVRPRLLIGSDLLYSSTMVQAAGGEQTTRGLGECVEGNEKAVVHLSRKGTGSGGRDRTELKKLTRVCVCVKSMGFRVHGGKREGTGYTVLGF